MEHTQAVLEWMASPMGDKKVRIVLSTVRLVVHYRSVVVVEIRNRVLTRAQCEFVCALRERNREISRNHGPMGGGAIRKDLGGADGLTVDCDIDACHDVWRLSPN